MLSERTDVIVIGSGPAGLHAAIALRRRFGLFPVIVEREAEAGGAPRWCHHRTFPCRVKKRLFTGPGYARAWVEEARAAGIPILTETTVLRLEAGRPEVQITSPRGPQSLQGRAILLATGAREAHRHQRLVPGDRAPGIFTTASLFQCLHLNRELPGRRFVVFGSEDVSYSSVQGIRRHKGEVAAVVEPGPATRSWPWLRWYCQRLRGVPHFFNLQDFAIHGKDRVEGVSFTSRHGGRAVAIACDAVVFTGGFTPNAELARASGLAFNTASRGPSVNQWFQTSSPGVFAAGNCLRGVVSGDEAALEGRLAAEAMAAWLAGRLPSGNETAVTAEAPLAYCCPDRLLPGAGGMPGIAAWPREHLRRVEMVAEQSGRILWRRGYRAIQPGRRLLVPIAALRLSGIGQVRLTAIPLQLRPLRMV